MSTVMRHRLNELEKNGTPIKAGVIGAGFFGCSTIGQASRTPGIRISIIADISKEKAVRGFVKFARRKPREIVEVKDVDTANHY
ncbi:hypothetical protein KEJ18_06355, partial [Candidatus Bathyarchaeota archaeon]|nr:hypothetical protein [Candidatus Bathyarchaeota archaeon]